jgi:hypothetical protein
MRDKYKILDMEGSCAGASMITGMPAMVLALGSALAQTPPKVKIGVLTDLTGSMSDLHGSGVFLAAHMTAEDFAEGEWCAS